MPTDVELMEANLVAVAEREIDIRHALFERFFAAFPDRRDTFFVPEATSIRMTDETLQMMLGLAKEEHWWVWPLIAELIHTHRSYGHLPMQEYDDFIDMTVDELGKAVGPVWTVAMAAAWQVHADELKALIRKGKAEWAEAMPHPSDTPGNSVHVPVNSRE